MLFFLNMSVPQYSMLQHRCCNFDPFLPFSAKNPQIRQKSPNPTKILNKNLSQKSQKIFAKNPSKNPKKLAKNSQLIY